MRIHRRGMSGLIAIAALSTGRPAFAGGAATREGRSRIAGEEALVVWNHRAKVQHTFLSARLRSRSEGAYLAAFVVPEGGAGPADAEVVKGVVDRLTELDPLARLTPGEGAKSTVVLPGDLSGACRNLGFGCDRAVSGWPEGTRTTVVLPFPAAADGGVITTPWAHVRQETAHPVLPFSDPPGEAPSDTTPQAVDDDHPPRVDLWVELGVESKTGIWEKTLDTAVHQLEKPVAACYAKVLAKLPRLTGNVHAQARLPFEGKLTVEGTRASTPSLETVVKCLETELLSADLPRLTGKNAPIEVHATLKPPIALPRIYRAVVLTSVDAEARLGEPESERLPPDTKLLASFEATPLALRRAFDDDTRRALGLDLAERWRVLVLESSAERHGDAREIAFRTLAFPTPQPGEAPLPVVARGDRPLSHGSTPPKWFRRARYQRLGLALGLAGGIAITVWLDARSNRRRLRRPA